MNTLLDREPHGLDLMQFFVLEGLVSPGYTIFKAVISDYDRLVNLICRFYALNIVASSIKFTQIWHCKAIVTEKITGDSLVEVKLSDNIWCEPLPDIVFRINLIIDDFFSKIFNMSLSSSINLVKRHLPRDILPFKYMSCKWVLIEFSHDGEYQRPVKIGVPYEKDLEDYCLSSFHVISLYNDFVTKTVLYAVDEDPFTQRQLPLSPLKSYDDDHFLDWSDLSVESLSLSSKEQAYSRETNTYSEWCKVVLSNVGQFLHLW